jgi:NAD(P)-dependent dehydrogenase (short-subunit alcohol dehydrogenase family)
VSETSKTLIVTGGSRGIGAEICKLAAKDGWKVAVNYASNRAAADRVVKEIQAAGGKAAAFPGDVAKEADILKLFQQAEQQLGPIGGLVNNAGISGGICRIEAVSADAVRDVLMVNVLGTILCAREAVKRMSTKHGGAGGVIVNLSSVVVRLGSPGVFVHYAASKGAIDTFTFGLAQEVAGEGIRVNAVSPGLIDTEIHAAAGDPERVAKAGPNLPMKRAGKAAEVAEAVVWMLSPKASYSSGAILSVSGAR